MRDIYTGPIDLLRIYVHSTDDNRLYIDPFYTKLLDHPCHRTIGEGVDAIYELLPHIVTVDNQTYRVGEDHVDFTFCLPCMSELNYVEKRACQCIPCHYKQPVDVDFEQYLASINDIN